MKHVTVELRLDEELLTEAEKADGIEAYVAQRVVTYVGCQVVNVEVEEW